MSISITNLSYELLGTMSIIISKLYYFIGSMDIICAYCCYFIRTMSIVMTNPHNY